MTTPLTVLKLTHEPSREETIAALYNKHHQMIYRTALAVTGSSADAEDILHNIFLALIERQYQPDLGGNPQGYLYRSAVNQSLKILKRRKRNVLTSDDDLTEIPDRTESSRVEENAEERLRTAMARLDPEHCEVLLLYYEDDYSIETIAAILGKTPAAVAMALSRIRLRLKKLLETEL